MKKSIFFIPLFFVFSLFANEWVYKKILIDKHTNIHEIEKLVEEILVYEEDFLLVRVEKKQSIPNVKLLSPEEKDFVQRNIKVYFNNEQELVFILNLGIDIWQKNQQSILGRAFDSQIQKMRKQSILIEKL